MNKSKVIKHLKDLGNDKRDPKDLSEGICDELKFQFGAEVSFKVCSLMPYWKSFSGDIRYPVPCSVKGDPKLRYINTKDLWRGKYGDSRKRLCLFLAEVLEKINVQNI